jgi:DivIVA domain-containing protein
MRKKDAVTEVGSEWSAAPAGRMTPADVQGKEFHVTRVGAGYRMREVDEFLDQVTDTLSALIAENDRLKATAAPERAGSLPMSRPAAAGPEDRGAVEAFLRREKGFLQDLGGLVQAHAEELRSMVRSVKREAVEPVVTPTAPVADRVEAAPEAVQAEEIPAPADPTPPPTGTIESPPAPEPEDEPKPDEPEPDEPEPKEAEAEAPSDRDDGRAPMATTQADGDEPILLEEREPARSRRSEDAEGNSLRELFWGEE